MKIVTPKEMARVEALAYQAGSKEETFMEYAGGGIAMVTEIIFGERLQDESVIILLCGKGNNTGDAYVAGIELKNYGYEVVAIQLNSIEECSPLCQKQYHKFVNAGGIVSDDIEKIDAAGLIIDGIFGTGFHGTAEDPYATAIEKANHQGAPILSIDIPSGLNGETGEVQGAAIHADVTAYLGMPKKGFFFDQGWNHIGKTIQVNFGLPEKYIEEAESKLDMLTADTLAIPEMVANRNKYSAGLVVGVAGSPGMPGAAILTSLATLRAGAGITRLLHPISMEAELSASPYELIRIGYNYNDHGSVLEALEKGSATFVGPAMGRTPEACDLLTTILKNLKKPVVIDADALFHIANASLPIPKGAILTPHTGEMARLLGHQNARYPDDSLIEECQNYAEKHQITLVLKGGPTFIFHPNEIPTVLPRGTPGLATAGTGDVLSGILAALMAQGLTPYDAAKTGCFLHAIAGEQAAIKYTDYGMIASDTIEFLPAAIQELFTIK